jgi:hypothetical protein
MIVLPAERSTRIVSTHYTWPDDDRIPGRLSTPDPEYGVEDADDREARAPRAVGWDDGRRSVGGRMPERVCERHLFDVIELTVTHVSCGEGDNEIVDTDFCARLTCVTCALVLGWDGRRTDEQRVVMLDPLAPGHWRSGRADGAHLSRPRPRLVEV